jgi:hypothetical protein
MKQTRNGCDCRRRNNKPPPPRKTTTIITTTTAAATTATTATTGKHSPFVISQLLEKSVMQHQSVGHNKELTFPDNSTSSIPKPIDCFQQLDGAVAAATIGRRRNAAAPTIRRHRQQQQQQ